MVVRYNDWDGFYDEEEVYFQTREQGKYYKYDEYMWEFDGKHFTDSNGEILYTFDGKYYYQGSKQTESTRIFITDEWEVSTLGKQKEIEEEMRNSIYSRSFLFDFYDTGEIHPKYGKKYYTDFEPLYSKDGENFYNEYGNKIATKKDGIYTFLWVGDQYQFDGKNFMHATQKMPYSWDGKEYYKFGKKLYFLNDKVYNYEPSIRPLVYMDQTFEEILWDGNQIGIDTGTIDFPSDITVQRLKRTKQIHVNGFQEKAFETWYPKKDTSIPKMDVFLETFLDMQGVNIQEMIWKYDDNGQPLLQIAGMAYRCQDMYEWIWDGFELGRSEEEFFSCLENGWNLHTNTISTQFFSVYSDTKQTVKFRIYPVNPEKYVFRSRESWYILPKLLVFDPVMDYYNIRVSKIAGEINSDPHLQRKYDVRKKEFFYAERQSEGGVFSRGEQLILYPYYQGEVSLQKWENIFQIYYETFTPMIDGVISIVEE